MESPFALPELKIDENPQGKRGDLNFGSYSPLKNLTEDFLNFPKLDFGKVKGWVSGLLDDQPIEYSPICFREVATPFFPSFIRAEIDNIKLSSKDILSLISRNQKILDGFNLNPNHVVTDLKRYVNFRIIENRIKEYNSINSDNIEVSNDIINSVFVIGVLEFQKKIISRKLNELKNYKEIDGVIGEKTLCSLGIIDFKNRSQKLNPLKGVINSLKKKEVQIQIGNKTCNHTNWNEFTFNAYFLGLSFNKPVHFSLVKQLRLAETYLMILDRFKNKSISQISDELGICHKNNQDHKGGRHNEKSNSMHNYGLALDVNYHGNPWIGSISSISKERGGFIYHMIEACKFEGIEFDFLNSTTSHGFFLNLAKKHNGNTVEIYDQIFRINDIFKNHLGKNQKKLAYWINSKTFKPGNRNPINGFMNLDKDLVVALRDQAGFCWGAVDLNSANGDMMHFDARTILPFNKLTHKTADKTHPFLINKEHQTGFEGELINGHVNSELKSHRGISLTIPVFVGKNLPFKTGVFVPTNYKKTSFVDLVIYLHGHMDKYIPEKFKKDGIEFYWNNYSKIKEFFEQSRGNAILLAPTLGLVSSKEFGDLGKPYGLDTYVSSCVDELKKLNLIPIHSFPFRIILATHSGGGKPLGEILNQENKLLKNVSEVWGFDCLYGDPINGSWVNNYAKWLSSKTEFNLKRYFFHFSATQTPTRAGKSLENRFPDNVVNIYLKNANHRTVIETAWKNYINKYPLFEPMKKFASWNPKKVKEYFEVSIDFYDSNGADSREFQENETNDSGFENSDQDDLGFIHQFEENPFTENFSSNELENEFNHQKAIGLNRKYSQSLGWGAYQEQIHEILLPYSGMVNVSLGEEAFTEVLARWQGENGLQPDGVLGPKTWEYLKSILNSENSKKILILPTQEPIFEILPLRRKKMGWVGAGGGDLRVKLIDLKSKGIISLSDFEINIAYIISKKESGKMVNAINSWDNQFMSMGFMQNTFRSNRLQTIISNASDTFKKFGIELENNRSFSFNGREIKALVGLDKPESLREKIWAIRFYKAGLENQVIIAQLNLLFKEIIPRLKRLSNDTLNHLYGRNTELWCFILEADNSRPTIFRKALAKTSVYFKNKENFDFKYFGNLLLQNLIQTTKEWYSKSGSIKVNDELRKIQRIIEGRVQLISATPNFCLSF